LLHSVEARLAAARDASVAVVDTTLEMCGDDRAAVFPLGALVTSAVDPDRSNVSVAVSGSVMWTLTTADRRLVTDGDARWTAADAASPPAFLTIDAALDPAEVGFEPLQSGSTLYLALALSAEGELVAVRIEEVWPRAADRNRVCVRAAMDAASLGCHDTGEGAGRD
jgi:hypothetical protein